MRVLQIAVMVMGMSVISFADTLRMEKNLEGENLPGNQVWAIKKLKSGETCAPWVGVCKTSEADEKQKCKSCVVKYLTGAERAKRKLKWDAATSAWLGQDGKPYDTARENAKYGTRIRTRYEVDAIKRWGMSPGIWVLDTNGDFYVSAEQSPGKFHHSSFLAGGLVEGAGQVILVNGRITHINNASGHYKPDTPAFNGALNKLHMTIIDYDEHSSPMASTTNVRRAGQPQKPAEEKEVKPLLGYSYQDYYAVDPDYETDESGD